MDRTCRMRFLPSDDDVIVNSLTPGIGASFTFSGTVAQLRSLVYTRSRVGES
jgi:hypothetical protein